MHHYVCFAHSLTVRRARAAATNCLIGHLHRANCLEAFHHVHNLLVHVLGLGAGALVQHDRLLHATVVDHEHADVLQGIVEGLRQGAAAITLTFYQVVLSGWDLLLSILV